MLQISAAVAAAHEAGIIHRDLKPANIFIVQRAEVPAVSRCWIWHRKACADSLDEDEPKTLTQVGAMIGTPRYMSPEQCNGAELTPAADVYSLGVILYEMLTGTVSVQRIHALGNRDEAHGRGSRGAPVTSFLRFPRRSSESCFIRLKSVRRIGRQMQRSFARNC